MIDDNFIAVASNLSFYLLMPTLLFFSILKADLHTALKVELMGYFYLATLLNFALAWLWAIRAVPFELRGIFVQGAFRGNCGIIGLALAASLYGDYGLTAGGVMAGLIIVLYNVLSIIVLSYYSSSFNADFASVTKGLVKNPLILSVLAGLLASWMEVEFPMWVVTSANYVSSMTLPLALICVGGSLSIAAFKTSGRTAISASVFKILWAPIIFTLGAIWLGFEGRDLGLFYLYMASPTAAASYVMVRASGGDAASAANIIVISTVCSIATTLIGLYLLQYFAFI